MVNQEHIKKFENLLSTVKREGIDDLLAFIRSTDFYTAPASTRYHSCHEGGLLEHSLNVYKCLKEKKNNPTWYEIMHEVGEESIIICALLHDLCKVRFYKPKYFNKKDYNEYGTKVDSAGRYNWVEVQGWEIQNEMPLGHGEKSCFLIMNYIKLKPVELYAIRWHMGFSEPKENYNDFGAACEKHPFVLALNEADGEATFLYEAKK